MSKNLALVAHDGRKDLMVEWVQKNKETLSRHNLYATGTTGLRIEQATDLSITKLESGPLGGDLELGSMIVRGKLDALFFFIDPLHAQPHEPDIKALLRITCLKNVVVAENTATSDILIQSPFFH